MKNKIPTFEEFINESELNETIELVYYSEVINRMGKTKSTSDPKEILDIIKNSDNWTDDMSFEDSVGRLHFIEDLIGQTVKIGNDTIKVTE